MTTDPQLTKVGESAFFFVDVRNYLAAVTRFDPILANQTVVFEPVPVEEPEPAPEEEDDREEPEPHPLTYPTTAS